jgi:coenzyme F420-reducing hydrogenase alpha subunit
MTDTQVLDRRLQVASVSRVEGEGRLQVVVRGDEVVEAHLSIFEAPRFFERLVVGRTGDEVIDIVARICGICPVAYQLTVAYGFERLYGVELDPEVRRLRRLLYWGEWLQSHALHIYLLHAPDFLGYPDALAMAKDHRAVVEMGLRLKHAGVAILQLLGGRAVHPVSLRVGGFSRVPSKAQLEALRPEIETALRESQATVELVSGFAFPEFSREPLMLALREQGDYAIDGGRIVSSEGLDIGPEEWESAFVEEQVPWSTALHARGIDGRRHLLGPSARIVLGSDGLHPLAAEALRRVGGPERIRTEMFRSVVARAVEMVHACAAALEIIDAYRQPAAPKVSWQPRAGVAAWATEAPRGLLFHRYDVDDAGLVTAARIVPPTSQNQAAIEDDLRAYLPGVLALPDRAATDKLEALIRCYDPCISCATHFLELDVARIPSGAAEGPSGADVVVSCAPDALPVPDATAGVPPAAGGPGAAPAAGRAAATGGE